MAISSRADLMPKYAFNLVENKRQKGISDAGLNFSNIVNISLIIFRKKDFMMI